MPPALPLPPFPPPHFRLALAVAVVKARSRQRASIDHWKKKAKARKEELRLLREELQQARHDSSISSVLPIHRVCKCRFFESDDTAFASALKDGQEESEVDQRILLQFFRNVRMWESSRKPCKNTLTGAISSSSKENQLAVVCKFLCKIAGKGECFASYAHQAFEFFKDALLDVSRDHKGRKTAAEGMVADLTSQLLEKILSFACDSNESDDKNMDCRIWILKLLTKLGTIPFAGQRILIMASDQTNIVFESLYLLDPFQRNVPQVHDNMMFMFRLLENLVLHHSSWWKNDEDFDERLVEEWIDCCVKLRNTGAILSKHDSLFLAYMERIICLMVKQLQQLSYAKQGESCREAFVKLLSS